MYELDLNVYCVYTYFLTYVCAGMCVFRISHRLNILIVMNQEKNTDSTAKRRRINSLSPYYLLLLLLLRLLLFFLALFPFISDGRAIVHGFHHLDAIWIHMNSLSTTKYEQMCTKFKRYKVKRENICIWFNKYFIIYNCGYVISDQKAKKWRINGELKWNWRQRLQC